MQKKNIKGYIALFLGLASIVLILVACFVPMTKLTGFGLGGKVSFYGTANVIMIVYCSWRYVPKGCRQKGSEKIGRRHRYPLHDHRYSRLSYYRFILNHDRVHKQRGTKRSDR